MPVRYKLETKGFSEYLERLVQAGKDIDVVADETLEAGGDVLLEGMQRRCRGKQATWQPTWSGQSQSRMETSIRSPWGSPRTQMEIQLVMEGLRNLGRARWQPSHISDQRSTRI